MRLLGKLLAVAACLVLPCPGEETSTTYCVNYITNGPAAVFQQDDDFIRRLVRGGEVCRVIGHIWESTPHVTLEYRPDGNYPEHRKCSLCGKVETKEPGAWK